MRVQSRRWGMWSAARVLSLFCDVIAGASAGSVLGDVIGIANAVSVLGTWSAVQVQGLFWGDVISRVCAGDVIVGTSTESVRGT